MQQTFVVSSDDAEEFTVNALEKLRARRVKVTELDLLYVLEDECLMSATYKKPGFAVTLTFENFDTPCPPPRSKARYARSVSCVVTCVAVSISSKTFGPQGCRPRYVRVEHWRVRRESNGLSISKVILRNPFSHRLFTF